MATQKRVCNTASPEKLAKVLRGSKPGGLSTSLLATSDMEKLVAGIADMLVDLLEATPRPTATTLRRAAATAWQSDPHEAEWFASRVLAALKYCRVKRNGATSFKKVSEAVSRVAKVMRPVIRMQLMSSPLKKRQSGEQSTSSPLKKRRLTSEQSPKKSPQLPISAATSTADRASMLRELYGFSSKDPKDDDDAAISLSSGTVQAIDASQETRIDDDTAQTKPKEDTFVQETFVETFNSFNMNMVRSYSDGTEVVGDLTPGPIGFAMVTFPGEEPKPTEIPSILLEPVRKVAVCKRPAAAPAPEKTVATASQTPMENAECVVPYSAADVETAKEKHAQEEITHLATKTTARKLKVHKKPAAAESVNAIVPADAEPKGHQNHKSSERHRYYSKIYHSTKNKLEKEGMENNAAKSAASDAARTACTERFG